MSIDERTDIDSIPGTVAAVRHAFLGGRTKPLAWRLGQLDALVHMLEEGGDELVAAMQRDFGKPELEAYNTDIAFSISEIEGIRKALPSWVEPRKAKLRLQDRPGKARIQPEPLGVSLVIAPWNYPVQLLVLPMATSIAAGNAVVAKPSELTPETSRVLSDLLRTHLDPEATAVFEGGPEVSTALLEQRWDHIFFTGSTAVGKIVARAAAEHLTPTVLELGGKSPAFVTVDADIPVVARRIAWAKLLNAGQTCIAPDYLLVEEPVKDALVDELAAAVTEFYGEDPTTSPDLTQVVNTRHATRLRGLLEDHGGTVAVGGTFNEATRKLAPTVIVDPDPGSPVMSEEIFGPILPVIGIDSVDDGIAFVNGREKPLALYVYGSDDVVVDHVVDSTSSGGVCVNHALFHITTPSLPFGGVGASGQGRYHGRAGFEALSNMKPILVKPTKPDLTFIYPPYTNLKSKLLKKLL